MIKIKHARLDDEKFWFKLDKHLPTKEFYKKVEDKKAYIIEKDEISIGVMRYNLFWDNIPFLTMIYIEWDHHKNGYGRKAMKFWENEMKKQGYKMLMTSTQVDEEAQHFYRKLGYKDCGCLIMDFQGFKQPTEIFMAKLI